MIEIQTHNIPGFQTPLSPDEGDNIAETDNKDQ
jgi:hypothetical protein